MKVIIGKKEIILKDNIPLSVEELLKELNLLKEEVIVIRKDKILLEKEKLFKNDEIEILKVISGG